MEYVLTSSRETVTFNGELDDNGVEWGLQAPTGWHGGSGLRQVVTDLPLRDGQAVGDAYRQARVIGLHGGIAHRDREVVREAFARLAGALDCLRSDATFQADEATPKYATVRRAAEIDTVWHGPVMEWSTTLIAADPRRYEVTEQHALLLPYVALTDHSEWTTGTAPDLAVDFTAGSGADLAYDFTTPEGISGTIECVNAGSIDVLPRLAVLGPTTNSVTQVKFTNETTGVTVEVDTTISTGQTLLMNMRAAAGLEDVLPVTLDGASRYGSWVSPRTPLVFVPGTNRLRFEVLAGTGEYATAHVFWRSGWE